MKLLVAFLVILTVGGCSKLPQNPNPTGTVLEVSRGQYGWFGIVELDTGERVSVYMGPILARSGERVKIRETWDQELILNEILFKKSENSQE